MLEKVDVRLSKGEALNASKSGRVSRSKPTHKGRKCIRNKPLIYDELKNPIKLSLTPTAIIWWESIASSEGCSISEAVERMARGLLANSGQAKEVDAQSRVHQG